MPLLVWRSKDPLSSTFSPLNRRFVAENICLPLLPRPILIRKILFKTNFADSLVRSGLCFAIHFLMSSYPNILYVVFLEIRRPVSARTCSYESFGFLRIYLRRALRSRRVNLEGRPERESVVPSWRCELRRRVDCMVAGVKKVFRAISAFPRPTAAQV